MWLSNDDDDVVRDLLDLPFAPQDRHPQDHRRPSMADMPVLAWTHLTLQRFDHLTPLLPLLGHLERASVSAGVMHVWCEASHVTDFWEVFNALDGKFDTPKWLEWHSDHEYPQYAQALSAVLSKAADRPSRLTLEGVTVDRDVLDALRSHAPQLRHLTLLWCWCDDPTEVFRALTLETLRVEEASRDGECVSCVQVGEHVVCTPVLDRAAMLDARR